ncbi:MAG: alkaline phosphatase D family protein [Betaproteobacteria bacterium]
MFNRREFLRALGALGVTAGLPARAQLNARPRFAAQPFTLGVASGYPQPGGFVLWTRLAPVPEAPGGGMAPEVIPLRWEVARDERLREIVASGTAYAEPQWAHSVHLEVNGLQPDEPYWYRFSAGDAQSVTARTRTAPRLQSGPTQMRFAVASCQHYEQGYFSAYRHIVADDPHLVLHLGDYIYESSWGRDLVRRHGTPEPVTLEDYRARYALYKSDADLQAAHAACPWLFTWDDHEVENDYAGERSENLDTPEWFLARRAAAYKAWYEHLPVPREMVPFGPHARIYTRQTFGTLADFHVLDNRQYRSPQVCPRPGRGGSNTVDVGECAALAEARRTMLGAAQEQWLAASLSASRAHWTVLVQQTPMAQFDQRPGPGRMAWTDGWDGYPAARRRILEHIAARKMGNVIVIGGDVHSFNVSDLKLDFDDAASPVVASEFVGTSITSQAWPHERLVPLLADNPHIKLADGRQRGYLRLDLARDQVSADLRVMDQVSDRAGACGTLASFSVRHGKPGAVRA